MLKKFTLAAAAALTAVTAIPAAAEAHQTRGYSNYNQQRAYYSGRSYQRCKSGTTGAIVGGAGGALLGREVAGRGDRTIGTILGAAVGGLAGRELTRTKRRNCR